MSIFHFLIFSFSIHGGGGLCEEFGVDKGGEGGLMWCTIKGFGGGGFMVW